MKKRIAYLSMLVLPFSALGAGFFVSGPVGGEQASVIARPQAPSTSLGTGSAILSDEGRRSDGEVVLPVAQYAERRTLKRFGTFVDDDRFYGYHLGEDVEFVDDAEEIPVSAIADGTVLLADWVSGYGGVMVVSHDIGVTAIYGHLDSASFAAQAGERVEKGMTLGFLGDGHTEETDGRRKHLHFGLYEGDFRVNGYTLDEAELATWIDPDAYFRAHGLLE